MCPPAGALDTLGSQPIHFDEREIGGAPKKPRSVQANRLDALIGLLGLNVRTTQYTTAHNTLHDHHTQHTTLPPHTTHYTTHYTTTHTTLHCNALHHTALRHNTPPPSPRLREPEERLHRCRSHQNTNRCCTTLQHHTTTLIVVVQHHTIPYCTGWYHTIPYLILPPRKLRDF